MFYERNKVLTMLEQKKIPLGIQCFTGNTALVEVMGATGFDFVMFDCVQFPRRGWVHRNRLPVSDGTTDWFTLPVARAPRDALISELVFAVDARERVQERRPPYRSPAPLDSPGRARRS